MVSWLGWCEVESSAVAAMAFRFGVLILALVICLNFNSVESDDGECCLQFQVFCFFFCVFGFFETEFSSKLYVWEGRRRTTPQS